MTPFSISKTSRKYRIVGMTAQRPALPVTATAAWREAALFGLPAGALLALPVALRTGGPFYPGFMVWLAACGLLGLATSLCTGLLRAGRPLPSSIAFVPLGLIVAAGPLAFIGKSLHATTHHRPLGAATFAVLALGITLGAMALGARTRRLLSSSNRSRQTMGRVMLYATVIVSIGLGLREFMALLGSAKEHPAYFAAILDGLLGVSLSLVGGFARFAPKLERVAKVAGPLSIAICVLALLVAFKAPNTSTDLARCLPLWAVLKST